MQTSANVNVRCAHAVGRESIPGRRIIRLREARASGSIRHVTIQVGKASGTIRAADLIRAARAFES